MRGKGSGFCMINMQVEGRLCKVHGIGESPHACMGEGLTGHASGVNTKA